MNKNILRLITFTAVSAAISACNSGNGGVNGGSTPSGLTITQVTAPAGSAPAQNLGAGIGTGSVFVNSTNGALLYLLGNSTGSVNAPLVANVNYTTGQNIIGASLTSPNILFGPVLYLPNAGGIAQYFSATLSPPFNTIFNVATQWESATLTNTNRTICFGDPIPGDSGCAGSNAPTGARLITSNSGQTQFMFVGYGQPGVLGSESIGYNQLSVAGTSYTNEASISLASCVAQGSATVSGESATTVSAIAASSFENYPFFIAGTNSGDLCVGIFQPDLESTAFANPYAIVNLTQIAIDNESANYTYESSPVTVNSTQALGGYNSLGAVNAIAATPQAPNNTTSIIAWTQGTSGVYSATITNPYINESFAFANLTDTHTYTNTPTNVSVIYVDFSNNIYVGTFSNQVYVLQNGSTTWLSATIPNQLSGSHIYNFSAGYAGNVYAYTANGESSAVYSLNFQ